MDIGLQRDEEHFSTFDPTYYLSPDGLGELDNIPRVNDLFECLDGIIPSRPNDIFDWNHLNDKEPEDVTPSNLTTSNLFQAGNPMTNDEVQKMIAWPFQNINASIDDFQLSDSVLQNEPTDVKNSSHDTIDLSNIKDEKFDLAQYVCGESDNSHTESKASELNDAKHSNEEATPSIQPRKVKAPVKKIDVKARKYIIEGDSKKYMTDEEDVDIETVSEEESSPVLQACDLSSLLEKFEAAETPNVKLQTIENIKVEPPENIIDSFYMETKQKKVKVKEEKTEQSDICDSKVANIDRLVKVEVEDYFSSDESNKDQVKKFDTLNGHHQSTKDDSTENLNTKKKNCSEHPKEKPKTSKVVQKSSISTTSSYIPDTASKKQILDSLPQELINRIKESGKRKPITVIPPIPNNIKKRPRTSDEHNKSSKVAVHEKSPKKDKPVTTERNLSTDAIHLEHNYCSSSSPSQNSKKDSGFESSEDDDRAIINKQPTVKNADGTLMVSLLKVNTIRSPVPQKKKLNLEEYKKRRKVVNSSNNTSQNTSPSTSSCSSPFPEDESTKIIRHQEKLKKMAMEVLTTAPKSEKKPTLPLILPVIPLTNPLANMSPTDKTAQSEPPKPVPPPAEVNLAPPPHLERKILVSFGVNTDFKIAKDEDPLAPVEKLEKIKPLLQKASDKINENSLITSLIENIPKVISKCEKPSTTKQKQTSLEHGENKQVLHLEKDREKTETRSIGTQTNISLIEQSKRGRLRRRSSSCSSTSSSQSSCYTRSRKSSDSSSVCSRSSRCSRESSGSRTKSRSSYNSRASYSRSRSRSPRYSRKRVDRDHQNAVEERRIIYVGRVSHGTTKEDLRRKFQKFGPITYISLHFRDHGYLENYGFVTFKYKEDAHEAYEHGNDDPAFPYYKISFGGRREFCKTTYSDLDNMRDDVGYYQPPLQQQQQQQPVVKDSFDILLKEMQEKLRKRKA